jgi:DNA polymerase family A
MSLETGFILIDKKRYEIVTIDFETFYSKDFTLSGKTINTSEYIRDDRFHAHGISIKRGNRKTHWYTGKNIALALAEIDWSKSAMLAHNTPFDGFICSHHFKILPAFYLDTLSMARAAHSHHMRHDLNTIAIAHGLAGKTKRAALADTKGKLALTPTESRALGAYCIDDTEDTYKIFWKLIDSIPDDELRLIDLTVRMFCDPVLDVDIPRVRAELEKEIGGKQAALLNSGADVVDLMSNDKFAALLAAAGAKLPMKISPSTGKMTYAFAKSDLDFQALGQSNNPKIAALCAARLKVKSTIGETRAVRFLEAGKDGMKLPVMLNYSGAHTHRWSGGNKLNLQNLVRGGELRKSILAPPGHVIVVADSAQIEARVLAWLAGQKDLLDAFKNSADPYSAFASLVFGYPVDRKKASTNAAGQYLNEAGQVVADKKDAFFPQVMEGFVGKVCVLGLGYGMGWAKFQNTLSSGAMGMKVELSDERCLAAVNLYRSRNYAIKNFWAKMDEVILAMITGQNGTLVTYGKGYIQLPNGLFLQYYGLHGEVEARRDQLVVREATYLTRMGRSKIYGGLAVENLVQALSRVIIGEQILKVSEKYRVVTTTHDEIVAICKKKDADKCLKDMLQIMSTPPKWAPDLPLAAEGGYDVNYSK